MHLLCYYIEIFMISLIKQILKVKLRNTNPLLAGKHWSITSIRSPEPQAIFISNLHVEPAPVDDVERYLPLNGHLLSSCSVEAALINKLINK